MLGWKRTSPAVLGDAENDILSSMLFNNEHSYNISLGLYGILIDE